MMRTSILLATLALVAVASRAEQASACHWLSGPACGYYMCAPVCPPVPIIVMCAPAFSSACVVVQAPADAKVFFDDQPTTSTGSVRFFTSPPLDPGGEFTYTVRAEATRDGQTVAETKEIVVRAFSTTEVDFGDLKGNGVSYDPELGPAPKAVRDVPELPRHPLEPAPGTNFDKVEKVERNRPK